MKHLFAIAGVLAAGLAVTGCTSIANVMDDNSSTDLSQAQAAPDLAMPPDLQLRAPSSVASPVAQSDVTAPAATVPDQTVASAAQPEGDIYARNGISRVNADGTQKTDAQLQAELKKVYLAKKQQQNPNYGTVYNMGHIFDGG